MMLDQADRLRRLVKRKELGVDVSFSQYVDHQALAKRKLVVFLANPDEIAAAANVMANLAAACVSQRRKTMILDTSMGPVDCSTALGQKPSEQSRDFFEILDNNADPVIQTASGVSFIKLGNVLEGLDHAPYQQKQRFYAAWSRFEEQSDMLCVFETSPRWVYMADTVIIYSSPAHRALTVAYENLKVLYQQRTDVRVCLIMNMCLSEKEGMDAARQLTSTARTFLSATIDILGCITLVPEVVRALKSRQLFIHRFPYARASAQVISASRSLLRLLDSRCPQAV